MESILHWNVRGLKTAQTDKLKKCCDVLDNVSSVQIFNLQETHLSSDSEIPNRLLNYSHLYHIVSSHANNNDKGAGILMFINKTEDIIEYNNYFSGRLLFVKMVNKASGEIRNVFSFYGKSHTSASDIEAIFTKLHEKITEENLSNSVIIGDFNFVTNAIDRNSSNFSATDRMYLDAWQSLETNLGLVDSFRITNPKRRLYTFWHSNGKSKSRIDRIYLTGDLQGKIVSTVFENCLSSDHKIVKLNLAQNIDTGPGQWVFNNMHLQDEVFVKEIKEIIADYYTNKEDFSDAKVRWEILKQNLASYAKGFGYQNSRKRKREHLQIKKKIEILEELPIDEVDDYVRDAINNLKLEEDKFIKSNIEGYKLRSKIPHIELNEKDISLYARIEKISAEKNLIYSLIDEQGLLKQDTADIMDVVYSFYSDLYTNEAECQVSQDYFLNQISISLSEEDRVSLDKDITAKEIREALSRLQNKKSPGSDGLTKEFYDFFWQDIEDHYLDCLKECEASGEMTLSQKLGLIRISYKKNGRRYIKNYRPITLINVDSKILTRTLATRMAAVLPKIIHHNQTCVPGRCISLNTHILQDLIDVINSEGIGAAIIFLDQEKAFDRMSHAFIIKVLRKFGFGERFIRWIEILYTDMRSCVKVNGYLTKEFSIKRGVRQGCPLSALIYVLCAEVLGIEIRSNKDIVGYKYNQGKNEHKYNAFADDNTVIVTTENSVLELFKSLDRYEAATNAKVNKDKTMGMWIGAFRQNNKDFAGIEWKDEPVESLGVYVGNNRSVCAVTGFSEAKEKIKLKMSYWNSKNMSIKGRVKVLNIFILSKLWYILESQDIPLNLMKDLNTLIKNFTWKGAPQVQFNSLHDRYEEGGLNLQDIFLKKQALRLKWLRDLVLSEDDSIEKFLANSLIGKHEKIVGLKILHSKGKFDKKIPCLFYRESVTAWRLVFQNYTPKNVHSIKRDWIYDNILLKDDDGRVFKPPSFIPPYAPEFFMDLPVTNHPREFRGIFRTLIPKINRAFMRISFNDNDKCKYEVSTRAGVKDLELCSFNDLYDSLLFHRKPPVKPWKTKWENEGIITREDWNDVWMNVHHQSINQATQSSLWIMLHRNFMCAYFAKLAYNEDGVCKLCNNVQLARTHIFTSCQLLSELYELYFPIINHICSRPITDKEKIMGLKVPKGDTCKVILRNYITSSIKHIVFRSRNINFGNFQNTKMSLASKISIYIKKDLAYKWVLSVHQFKVDSFSDLYLQRGILGHVDPQNHLILNELY